MIYIFIALWLIIGVLSIVYWWTDTQPLEVQDLLMIMLASILGLFAFVVFTLPILISGTWFKGALLEKVLIRPRDERKRSRRYEDYNRFEWPGEDK